MGCDMASIVQIYTIFDELSKENVSFKISYWIGKNLDILGNDYNFFVSERFKLYNEYLEVINNSYITQVDENRMTFNFKDPDQSDEFIDKFNELLSMDCVSFEPYVINIDILMDSDLKVSASQIKILQSNGFIKE